LRGGIIIGAWFSEKLGKFSLAIVNTWPGFAKLIIDKNSPQQEYC
jgi:hypothetical protein